MSKDDCKQRFKGVENFLRRVAFNLGNTPSQTEVKVISCIPIDVTDLQKKIVQLEKQLEQQGAIGKVNNTESKRVVNTAICNTPYSKHSNAAISCKSIGCCLSRTLLHNQNCTTQQNRSSISFVCPAGSDQPKDCFYSKEVSEMTYTKKRKPTECRRMFFNKRKVPKKAKVKTQLVYYAQTEQKNPFNSYFPPDDGTSKKRGNVSIDFNRSYLTDMIREQYKHGPVHEGTNVSEFSTPICRDITHTPKIADPQHYESDMCSCCHGQFHNIDNHNTKNNHLDIFSSQTDSKNAYYDASLYDVIPVKENAVKVKHLEFPKIKAPRNQMNIACWPENIRPKNKVSPMIVHYSTVKTKQPLGKVPVKHHSRKEKELKITRKQTLYGPVNRKIITKLSNTRSVEFSEVYTKRLERNRRKIPKSTAPKVRNRNDAACLTTGIAECQTTPVTNGSLEHKNEKVADIPLPEDKTKETLSQIKDILQSVLTEVKTNSKMSKISGQNKKKDAVVQNGLSQSNIYAESSLLQSFTYSPYSMDPYGPSCSQQRHPSSLYYPNIPPSTAKYMPHYPLFVQPGRNNCTSGYGNNPQVNKLPVIRRAASTATNTEDLQIRSKETENLIKEIYKAMALNIEIPSEDPLGNEHGDINQGYITKPEDREAKHIAKAISEIFKNTNPMHSSVTQNTGTPFDSKLASNETSYGSQRMQNYAQSISKESADVYSNDVHSEATDNEETEQVLRELESDDESDVTVVNEVTESSASETESEDEDVAIAVNEPYKEPKKKGLFSKMLKIFMSKTRNRKKNKGRKEDEPSEYDSVEYRTLHRYRYPVKPVKNDPSKTHAVVYYSKKPKTQNPASLPQRTPYMEQEYRRYFNERLTFHDKQYPEASTRESTSRKRPVYYQKVEARSAFVDHFNQRQRNEARLTSPKTEVKCIKQYRKQNEETYARDFPVKHSIVPPKAISWLEKHKLGLQCGKQWKKIILEG